MVESAVASAARGRPDNPIAETGIRAEISGHGLSSRLGRNRTDVGHHALDPVVVAGPWVAGAAGTAYLLRRVARHRRR
ncbi:hypothetical protein [Nocardioides pantholopis]|uniref:hypothetical protein n=1 Tax=Nocardioides pantholopis TaxID=2483798 RepID=UPI001F152945|nr:hypothetical protein [Nocardioides pantholopis]